MFRAASFRTMPPTGLPVFGALILQTTDDLYMKAEILDFVTIGTNLSKTLTTMNCATYFSPPG